MDMESKKMTNRKIKQSGSEVTFNVVNYIVFGILTFICVYPFY